MMNLAVNARDEMPEGGDLPIELSKVTVGVGEEAPAPRELSRDPVGLERAGPPAGEFVCLAVFDTGAGIPTDVLPHIFEPFFTTKGPGKGAGLGLAQVDGIVAQHKGHIRVETKPAGDDEGEGTIFRVYLPVYRAGHEELSPKEAAPAAPAGRGETILLVEDQGMLGEVGRQIPQAMGYQVLTAANGKEGLEVFERVGAAPHRAGVDLVLTDVVMPEIGGKRLMQKLRRRAPALRVLAMTSYTVQEDLQALRGAGFVDVIYKPFEIYALAELLRRWLDSE